MGEPLEVAGTNKDACMVNVRDRRQSTHQTFLDLDPPEPRSKWFLSDICEMEPPVVDPCMDDGGSMVYTGTSSNPLSKEKVILKYFTMTFPILRHPRIKEKVFVRPCYETLFDLLLENIVPGKTEDIVVTGNSGVGTSRFYAYCGMRLSQELLQGKTLIINAGDDFFVFESGHFHRIMIDKLGFYKCKSNVVRLIDGISSRLLGWCGVSILFTSQSRGRDYEHFYESSDGPEYVMPPWTYTELNLAAHILQLDKDMVKMHYFHFGGIPRYVFSDSTTTWESKLSIAISTVDLPKLMLDVDVNEGNYKCMLVHMYPSHRSGHPYTGLMLKFASREIAEQIFTTMVKNNHNSLHRFMLANHGEGYIPTGFKESLFEILCHSLWSSPCAPNLEGRYLKPGSQNFSIPIPRKIETYRFSKLEEIPATLWNEPLYCQPIGTPYPGIDAIYWDKKTCYLLQMSRSDWHSIKYASLVKILKWWNELNLLCENKLPRVMFVFVVPEEKWQDYNGKSVLAIQGNDDQGLNQDVTNLSQCIISVDVGWSLASVSKALCI